MVEQDDPRAAWVRDREIRRWMGPKFENPIPAMVEAVSSSQRFMDVRRTAPRIGAAIVPELAKLLDHKDVDVRQQTIKCLRKIGKAAGDARPGRRRP